MQNYTVKQSAQEVWILIQGFPSNLSPTPLELPQQICSHRQGKIMHIHISTGSVLCVSVLLQHKYVKSYATIKTVLKQDASLTYYHTNKDVINYTKKYR